MRSYLRIRLEAPLMSFGGVAIDNRGVEMPFPAASLVTGLLGNALGYRRDQADRIQRLQDRLRYAVRIDRDGQALQDFQAAELRATDKGWTTRGQPEGRDGGAGTYQGKHLRYRDYGADRKVWIALTLEPADESPTLEELADALNEPARPLFIGRKSCIPAEPLCAGIVDADSAAAALATVEFPADVSRVRLFEPCDSGPDDPEVAEHRISGLRIWANQLHGGEQRWRERWIGPQGNSHE